MVKKEQIEAGWGANFGLLTEFKGETFRMQYAVSCLPKCLLHKGFMELLPGS